MNRTDLFLFESEFARNTYQRVVGTPKSLVRCVFNGVTAKEFDPLVMADDATDVVYVGEFRHIKGADILIEAVAKLRAEGKPVTLTLAGDGEETATLRALCDRLNLGPAVRFIGHVPARFGFSKGRLLVVPSRGDSMPYVVIEAAAAGMPMIAANVGGIPEIFGPFTDAPRDAERSGRAGQPRSPPRWTIRPRRAGARKTAARARVPALLAAGDGRRRARRLSRRLRRTLMFLYRR